MSAVASGGVEAVPFAIETNLRRVLETAKQAGLWILGSSEHQGPRLRMKEDDVLAVIRELNAVYVQQERSFRIIQVAGGFQFATMPEFAEWLGRMVKEKAKRKLSQATIETLSVIAYKQPATMPEIQEIRGVSCAGVTSVQPGGAFTLRGTGAAPRARGERTRRAASAARIS